MSSQQQNLSILTDAQKARLNTLNDAIKLAPTISEAQQANLLSPPISPAFSFTGVPSFSIGGSVFSGAFGQGCAVIVPANRILPLAEMGESPTGAASAQRYSSR